jgi:metal-responsive CopG/Arc/MetJ family transcriptional regulator
MIYSYREQEAFMERAVKKTISLPPELAREAESVAKEEGKTLSAVIQDALRAKKEARLRKELSEIQGYWSGKAKERGILTEKDLKRYLGGN